LGRECEFGWRNKKKKKKKENRRMERQNKQHETHISAHALILRDEKGNQKPRGCRDCKD